MNILILNGANLNMLGIREVDLYGKETLKQINSHIAAFFPDINFEFFQSNFEGKIIEKIQSTSADGVIINAGAYTHYSIAIRDAILSRKDIPFIEVHLTDPKTRESFRQISLLEDICLQTFSGKQETSYIEGISYLQQYLRSKDGKV